MAAVVVNGRVIPYTDSGGNKPALVLAHGFFMDRTMFNDQVRELSDSYRVVTWDARGHGQSPAEARDARYSYWDQARDCLLLMDFLAIRSAVIGGMSQGGYIAMRTAILAPNRVAGLALIATEPNASDAAEIEWYENFFSDWVQEGPVDDLVGPLAARLIGPPTLSEPWIKKWRSTRPEGILAAARCLMYRDDFTPYLSAITCTAAIIHGTDDAAVPLEVAYSTAESLGGPVQFTEVTGGTHSVSLTNPAVVNSALIQLLAVAANQDKGADEDA